MLITIEIDKDRNLKAKANFEQASLANYIDTRLGDTHELVSVLYGKYDFLFSDTDNDRYKNYFISMVSKIVMSGCFVAHNVNQRTCDIREFLDYIESFDNHKTTINSSLSISYKTGEK